MWPQNQKHTGNTCSLEIHQKQFNTRKPLQGVHIRIQHKTVQRLALISAVQGRRVPEILSPFVDLLQPKIGQISTKRKSTRSQPKNKKEKTPRKSIRTCLQVAATLQNKRSISGAHLVNSWSQKRYCSLRISSMNVINRPQGWGRRATSRSKRIRVICS